MNSNEGKEKFFVIYQITNLIDGRIYVGAHCTYNVNDKYMGSSKYLKKDMDKLGKHNFRKNILYTLDSKDAMMAKEAEIVNREFCHRLDTYNLREGGKDNFILTGMLCVKDQQGNKFIVYKDDPRYISGEVVCFSKGEKRPGNRVPVKDKLGNCYSVFRNDPRYISGELVHICKGNKNPNKKGTKNPNKIGYPCSDEQKKRHSEYAKTRTGEKAATFGTYWVNNGITAKIIKQTKFEQYTAEGWIRGRKLTLS